MLYSLEPISGEDDDDYEKTGYAPLVGHKNNRQHIHRNGH